MVQIKRDEDDGLWRDPAHKYQEVHEEINRRKKEDKHIEDALFHVVQQKQVHMQFSNNEVIAHKQRVKKLFGFLKFGKK